MKLGFLVFIIPILLLLGVVSFIIFKAGISFGIIRTPIAKKIASIIIILMPIVLIATMTIGGKIYSPVNNFFYLITVIWLPILVYLSIGIAILFIIKFIATKSGISTGENKTLALRMFPVALSIIIAVCGLIVFGIVNASIPRVVYYEINSPSLSKNWAVKNIILVSDLHLGVVRSENFMNKVVKKINSEQPDIVLIAGDIIDSPVFNYRKSLLPLNGIKSKLGIFYTPGNHEAYNNEPEIFFPIIKSLSNTLIDRSIEINGTNIIGVDFSNESLSETSTRISEININKNLPSIALLHDPKNTQALLDAGISLVVSGHTHCGQFFPINLIVRAIYGKYTYGISNQTKDGASITSCGAGTAMSPIRIGTNSEIVVIHIH